MTRLTAVTLKVKSPEEHPFGRESLGPVPRVLVGLFLNFSRRERFTLSMAMLIRFTSGFSFLSSGGAHEYCQNLRTEDEEPQNKETQHTGTHRTPGSSFS